MAFALKNSGTTAASKSPINTKTPMGNNALTENSAFQGNGLTGNNEQKEAVRYIQTATALETGDVELICALAAMQLRYGKAGEAVAYLASLHKSQPDNLQVMKLFAVALMKLGRWEEAEKVLTELDTFEQEIGSFQLLYRSLIEFKRNQVSKAQYWFTKYVENHKSGARTSFSQQSLAQEQLLND